MKLCLLTQAFAITSKAVSHLWTARLEGVGGGVGNKKPEWFKSPRKRGRFVLGLEFISRMFLYLFLNSHPLDQLDPFCAKDEMGHDGLWGLCISQKPQLEAGFLCQHPGKSTPGDSRCLRVCKTWVLSARGS